MELALVAQLLRPAWRRTGAIQVLVLVGAFGGWQLASGIAGQAACG